MFDEELILKVFRRLEAGINPELELLRFLTEHGFENIAQLVGWYAYSGRPMDATLGILQRFVPGGRDGFELALDAICDDSEAFVTSLHRLGEVTGHMHTLLGSEIDDPAFAPESPSSESLGLLTAAIDDEIESVFVDLPDDNDDVAPIRGRGEEVRDRLRLWTQFGGTGQVIRHHGDFHLGQTLWADGDWVILDFEGEPARSLPERRRKRSPLRDVAGMLRSFSYAASAAKLLRGCEPPDGWEQRARVRVPRGVPRDDRSEARPVRRSTRQAARRVRAREGRLRAALRAEQPPRLAAYPGRRPGADARRGSGAVTQARASAFGELDIWLARAGRHEELWSKLGAHPVDGGVRFAVWAPNARQVSVVGDFNDWDPAADPLLPVVDSGIWEGIVDGAEVGQHYKYDLDGREKADPLAFEAEVPPKTASVVHQSPMCGRTPTGSTSADRASNSSARSRSTRCTRPRGGPAWGGASSRSSSRRTCRTSASPTWS